MMDVNMFFEPVCMQVYALNQAIRGMLTMEQKYRALGNR